MKLSFYYWWWEFVFSVYGSDDVLIGLVLIWFFFVGDYFLYDNFVILYVIGRRKFSECYGFWCCLFYRNFFILYINLKNINLVRMIIL